MKIALLGFGKEGQATKEYFEKLGAEFDIFENLTPAEISGKDYSSYDIIFRSPSIPPLPGYPQLTSLTRYFFDHCPCPIIGVTATKGKGTTCSFIKSLLDAHGLDAYLVGNIGTPAIKALDSLTPNSVVVYEMSSFQLWDLEKSPHIAVIGQIEPDHLNVHRDYADYLAAKGNICRHQSPTDYVIYYQNNPESVKIAGLSPAQPVPYPFTVPDDILSSIQLPGQHNQENAIAAIAAVASYNNISPDEYLHRYSNEIRQGLSTFHGLPHRLEYVRTVNGVKYYDDNFSTNPSSTRVAINAFLGTPTVIIVGGRDKTNNADLPEIHQILQAQNLQKIILLGESGHALAEKYQDPRFTVVESLKDAVSLAKTTAEALLASTGSNPRATSRGAVVLMSPSAASFDMFDNVYDRGEKFQALVNAL